MPNAQEPRRWIRGGHTAPDEARAAELFSAARELPPLPPELLVHAEAGISAALASSIGTARWVKVLFASAVVGGGSLAYAAWSRREAQRAEPDTAPPAMSTTEAATTAAPAAPAATDATALAVAIDTTAVTPATAAGPLPRATLTPEPVRSEPLERPSPTRPESQVPAPARPARESHSVRSVAAATSGAGGLAREAALLQEALRSLEARAPVDALRAVDTLAREFPEGQLMAEATVARVDALVAAGRRDEALHVLDARRELDGLPRAAELELLRAELRAEAGRCRTALETFEATIGRAASSALVERAWRGRVRCRSALGDQFGAERDAAEYLRRFPRGPGAVEMRELAAP